MNKKGIIIGSVCGFFLCFVLVFSLLSKPKEIQITLSFKNDIQAIEYGDKVDLLNYIDKVDGVIENPPVVDSKKIGKQKLTYVVIKEEAKKSFDLEVEVIDTQKPTITLKQSKVTLEINDKFDPLSLVQTIQDPVDGNLEYRKDTDVKEGDKSYYTYQTDLKLDKAGKYTVHFKGFDFNNNETNTVVEIEIKEAKKVVVEKPVKPTAPIVPTAPIAPTAPPPTPPAPPKETTQADYTHVLESTVNSMKASQGKNKIVVVTSTNTSTSTGLAQYFEKENGNWVEKMKTTAYLGRNGMGVGVEGGRKSPIGTYHFTKAYGIKPNPGSVLSYTQLNGNHYWCGDKYYNQFIDVSVTDHEGCDISKDERLVDYPGSYDYFAAFNYNPSNTPGKGAAYFLHCGTSYTLGCVSVAKSQMIYLLNRIDSSTAFVIAQIKNIQNY